MAKKKLNLLFVDDDKSIHYIVEDALTALGLQVFTAYDTHAADEVRKHEKLDLIICDLLMDEEDGLAYTRRLRASGEKTPVLLMSGLVNDSVIDSAAAAGANGCMSKPFEIGKL
jgi:two-component system phosphate regulon response regulator OmpR